MTVPSTDSARAEDVLPRKVAVSPEALYQVVEGEAVLLHLGSQVYYSLDDVGSRIWELLVTDPSPASIVTQLLSEYDTTEAVLRQDLHLLLTRLAEAGLVRIEA